MAESCRRYYLAALQEALFVSQPTLTLFCWWFQSWIFLRERAFQKLICAFLLPIAHLRMSSLIDILVALSILMGYSVTTASFVTYVVREHQTKAKQLQHISGIGVTCYWVTNFIYDMVSNLCHCRTDSIGLSRRSQFHIWDLLMLVCSDHYHKIN